MRTTKCVDCGCEISVAHVRGPMPKRCRACARERVRVQKKAHDELAKKAGIMRRKTVAERIAKKSLSKMSPVRRRIEIRRRANREYYSYCAMP